MADNKVVGGSLKPEDIEKYVSLAKDVVQLGMNLTPDDTVAKKVLRVVDALLAKGCVVDTGVFMYNVVSNFGNKDNFNTVLEGGVVAVTGNAPVAQPAPNP